MTFTPGAVTSGFPRPSTVGPRELKPANMSSPVATVFLSSRAPTAMTLKAVPGAVMPSLGQVWD